MKDNAKGNPTAVCPRCGQVYAGRPALSRADGRTPICPDCGVREALESIGVGGKERERILEIIHGCVRDAANPRGDG